MDEEDCLVTSIFMERKNIFNNLKNLLKVGDSLKEIVSKNLENFDSKNIVKDWENEKEKILSSL